MAQNVALSAKQLRAISALMTARSVDAAAEACGVSARQLWRWLSEPEFVAELRGATAHTIEQTARRLSVLSSKAIDVLEGSLTSDAASTRQLRAADVTLKHLAGLRDLADIEQRLAQLEAAQHDEP